MGFWKKFAKIGAMAAPFIAAPFTGGASLALIGAGAGAVPGLLDHNLKGAALGAGLGAIPGIGKLAKGGSAAATGASAVGKTSTAGKIAGGALSAFGGGGEGDQGPSLEGLGMNRQQIGNMLSSGISNAPGKAGGVTGFLGKLKSAGIDPTALGLGALSLLGDDGGPQKLQSFKGTGPLTDPVKSLGMSQDLLLKLGQSLGKGGAPMMRPIHGLPAPAQSTMSPLLQSLFDSYLGGEAPGGTIGGNPTGGGGAMLEAAKQAVARRKV